MVNTQQILSDGDREIALKYTVLATKDKDIKIWDYSVLKYMTDDSRSLRQVSFFEKGIFSGPLYFYSFKGQVTKIEGYTKGELISTFTDSEKGFVTATSKVPEIGGCGSADGNCVSEGGGPGSGGIWKTVVTRLYTDWYNVRPNGDMDYNGSTSNGYRLDRVWVSTGGSGQVYHMHHTGGYGPSSPTYQHGDEEIIEEYPSCESFEYSRLGSANWITAGVSGVWDVAIKWGRCPGLAAASYVEPLYFQLPGYFNNEAAASTSAFYLWRGFENWGNWYRRTYAEDRVTDWNPRIRAQLLTEIKESFAEIGGRVDKIPPAGFNGIVTSYKEAGIIGDNCN